MFDAQKTKPLHGGDLTTAAEAFGTLPEGWVDLSTGINSASYAKTEVSENALRMLPTTGDNENLLAAAKHYYRAPQQANIISAPGTQAVLQNLPLLYPDREIAILSPTYSEHRHTWEQAGNDVTAATSFEALSSKDIAVLVNPNNPDGQRHSPDEILKLAEKVELLVVDEAFCDDSPDLSIVPHLASHNILVLRSLGKFFGLAGLRLGFVIGLADITENLAARLGPWAVSGPAIEIGARALSDSAWIENMQQTLDKQSARLNELLKLHNLKIIGGTELFTLIETRQALDIYTAFAKTGILVRRFEDQPHWLRIGLPGAENEWQRLEAVLDAIDDMAK